MFLRVLHAEMLKLKRTLAFRMVFIAPLLVATLQFFILWNPREFSPSFNLWEFITKGTFGVWAIFMLPLLVTLVTALLSGLEHTEKQWKHIFALPIPRYAVYVAKLFVSMVLMAGSTLFLLALTLFNGWLFIRIRPKFASAGAAPIGWMLKTALFVWLAAWLIIAIHTWISVRWASFTVTLGAGIGGTFFALFAASAKLGKFYPWLLPVNIFTDDRMVAALWLGILGGIVAAILGCLEFTRRDVM